MYYVRFARRVRLPVAPIFCSSSCELSFLISSTNFLHSMEDCHREAKFDLSQGNDYATKEVAGEPIFLIITCSNESSTCSKRTQARFGLVAFAGLLSDGS